MRQSSLDLFHSHRRLRALNKPIYLPILLAELAKKNNHATLYGVQVGNVSTSDLLFSLLCFECRQEL